MTVANDRAKNGLKSKFERESQWTSKMAHNGIEVCDSVFNESMMKVKSSANKLTKIKKAIQDTLKQKLSDYWGNYVRPLIQQGKILEE